MKYNFLKVTIFSFLHRFYSISEKGAGSNLIFNLFAPAGLSYFISLYVLPSRTFLIDKRPTLKSLAIPQSNLSVL